MASTTGKQLADLRWCLTSPSLIRSNVAEGATWPDDDWFARLEPGNPLELPRPPHAHHFRLGQHFETLALLERPEAEQATHLAMIDDNGNEISRGFVVTRQWLDRATPTP